MTETQERFLRAVAGRLPMDRVAEVHLFPPMRQGGVETGVAVIAVEAEPPAAELAGAAAAGDAPAAPVGPAREGSDPSAEPNARGTAEGTAGEPVEAVAAGAAGDPGGGDHSGEVAADAGTDAAMADVAGADVAAAPPPRPQDATERRAERHQFRAHRTESTPGAPRHVIFSARYRLTLKGPDRGRWEADVVAEADAPLATADAVVRGVRKRTGEAADAERVSPDAFRLLVGQPA